MTRTYGMGWRVADQGSSWAPDTACEAAAAGPADDAAPHFWARRGPKRPLEMDQAPCLDSDVINAYRRLGENWQVRINEVLRAHIPNDWH